jgi:hypothetical protein
MGRDDARDEWCREVVPASDGDGQGWQAREELSLLRDTCVHGAELVRKVALGGSWHVARVPQACGLAQHRVLHAIAREGSSQRGWAQAGTRVAMVERDPRIAGQAKERGTLLSEGRGVRVGSDRARKASGGDGVGIDRGKPHGAG